MKHATLLACVILLAGCGATVPIAERQYLDVEAQRMAQRPSGVLVAGCVLFPVDGGVAMLQEASQRLANGFGNALNRQLADAGQTVAKSDTPRLCLRNTPPTDANLAGAYERLLGALAAVSKARSRTSFSDFMIGQDDRKTLEGPTARWNVVLDEADARLLATEFGTTDLWVLRAKGTSVDQLATYAGNLVSIVASALVGANQAVVSNAKNDLSYEISLVDLERREIVWMKVGPPNQINPETTDVTVDERFADLLKPFLQDRTP